MFSAVVRRSGLCTGPVTVCRPMGPFRSMPTRWARRALTPTCMRFKSALGTGCSQRTAPQEARALPLAGKQLVVTGRLSSMSRSQAEDRIKELGGSVGSSVSRKTTYLVAGEEPGSKLDQAEKLGTPILDQEQFIKLLEGHMPDLERGLNQV